MKPTSVELIESISWSLDNKVAPHVDDKWGASTLRSVSCLLEHLTARVDAEGQLLFDDNADLDALSDTLAELLSAATGKLADAVSKFGATRTTMWREGGAFPTIASLAKENNEKQQALDRVIATISGIAGPEAEAAVEAIDAYLSRHLERERPLFTPVFMKPAF